MANSFDNKILKKGFRLHGNPIKNVVKHTHTPIHSKYWQPMKTKLLGESVKQRQSEYTEINILYTKKYCISYIW